MLEFSLNDGIHPPAGAAKIGKIIKKLKYQEVPDARLHSGTLKKSLKYDVDAAQTL